MKTKSLALIVCTLGILSLSVCSHAYYDGSWSPNGGSLQYNCFIGNQSSFLTTKPNNACTSASMSTTLSGSTVNCYYWICPSADQIGIQNTSSSAKLKPTANKIVKYESQITNSTPVLNFDYTNNPNTQPCPNVDPNAFTQGQLSQTTDLSSTSSTNPLNQTPTAPDIESILPTGTTTAPPDQCTVTSRVDCYVTGTSGPTAACGSATSTNIVTPTIAAVCPDGYAQVGSYNMQPAVVYNPVAINKYSPTDIKDMNDYNALTSQGYACKVPSANTALVSSCLNGNSGSTVSYTWGYGINTAYANPTGATGVVMFDHVEYHDNGPWVKNRPAPYNYNAAYSTADCAGTGDPSTQLENRNGTPTYNASTSRLDVGVYQGIPIYSTYLYFYYGNVQCTLSQGPHLMSYSAPRSLVCARIKSRYDTKN